MRFKLIVLFTVFVALSVDVVYGQWDAQLSQYWKIKSYYNPSFIGEVNGIENVVMHRKQWVGITNAPGTSIASFNMPFDLFGKRHAAGFMVVNEKIGLFSNTTMSLQYAYKFKLKNNKTLNIGLQGSMANIDFDAGRIHIPDSEYHDPQDPAKPTGGEDKAFDMGLGVSWIAPKYYIGFGVSHLWEPTFELDAEHESYMARGYYLTGGYNIELWNPLIEFQPSALIKSDAVVTQIDVTAKVQYKKMFTGGISWRRDDGFIFLLGVRLGNIDAGYAYDLSTSEVLKASSGSHELFLRYVFPLKNKKPKGRHKSIRLL